MGQENLEYIHVGADEVFNLGSCQSCKLFVQEASQQMLYVKFFKKVLKKIRKRIISNIEIIAWDDMFRGWQT